MIFVKNLKKLIFSKIIILIASFAVLFPVDHVIPSLLPQIAGIYNNLALDPSTQKQRHTQTLTYLNKPNFRKQIDQAYKYKINEIGSNFFENLLNDVITREIDNKDKFYVFYHGQDRVFLLSQDMFSEIYKIKFKEALNDFFMLRVPTTKDFNQFKNIQDFLKQHIKTDEIKDWFFDEHPNIKKVLLSVNPSLFGNTSYLEESTFHYFINSSNASYINTTTIIKSLFDYFKISHLYSKYINELNLLSSKLSAWETKKTGLLIQIFIPKEIVDSIAYRCKPWGLLYHNKPEYNPASYDLEKYNQDSFSFLTTNTNIDHEQFRLLFHLANNGLLNHKSGIKMFRYTNETENINQYKQDLKKLLDALTKEILK